MTLLATQLPLNPRPAHTLAAQRPAYNTHDRKVWAHCGYDGKPRAILARISHGRSNFRIVGAGFAAAGQPRLAIT